MGIIRKTVSLSTLGLVRFRNRDERLERFARQTRNAARMANVQRGQALELQRDGIAQADVHHIDRQSGGAISGLGQTAPPPYDPDAPVAPAGWYPDGHGATRYFDGHRWTDQTR